MAKKVPAIVKKIQKTQIADIDYRFQTSISYSQISTYHQCPHKWKLMYVDKVGKFEHNIHSTFGTAMHESVQGYLKLMYEKSKAEADRKDWLEIFKENLKKAYLNAYSQNDKTHFSNPGQLDEFYNDGAEILKFFTSKTNKYFSKRGWWLVGIEMPLRTVINPKYPNVIFTGYIDLVMYHEPTNTFKLYDFKTSTRSWNDYQKKDEQKQFQLILYKYVFSKLFGIEEKNIDVEFMVLKRKIYEDCDFPQPRIQIVAPPSGVVKINKALKMVNTFIEDVFDSEGKFREKNYIKNITECKYCTFNESPEHCDKMNVIT